MKRIVLYILLLLVVAPAYSQINRGGKPFMYDSLIFRKVNDRIGRSPEIRNIIEVADLNRATEEARIEQITGRCNSCRGGGRYYGREIDLGVDFFRTALMTPLDDGELWILKIVSEKSEGFQFIFKDFYLPSGCMLFFYNDERTMQLGAFSSANNRDDNQFITQHLNGNIAHVELFIPDGAKERPRLLLDKVVYIFDNSLRVGPFTSPNYVDTCQINIACTQGWPWQQESKSVAMILLNAGNGYHGFCSGALINKAGNYQGSEKPYFLTANHCYQSFNPTNYSNLDNWVFLFRHESPLCNSNGWDVSNSLTNSVIGATIAAKDNNSATSDYLLLKLKNTVDDISVFDISFAGWNRDENPVRTSVVGIHHPQGDIKKISISYNQVESAQYISSDFTSAPDHHWKVVWSEGITAVGSSGSPLFNNHHHIIGFLTGGKSFCKYPAHPDMYGKFSKAFNSGNFQNYLGYATSVDTYVPPMNNSLPLTIETVPAKNIFKGYPVKVKVTAGVFTAPINYCIQINKTPNDFTDYQCGTTTNCVSWSGSNNTGIIETGNHTFSNVGTYKGRVIVWDYLNRQSTVVFSIIVSEPHNPCVNVYIHQINTTSNQLVLPKGTNLCVEQICGVQGGSVPYLLADDCYSDYFTFDPYTAYSYYQSIGKIEWYFNDGLVPGSTRTFNIANISSPPVGGTVPPNPSYYTFSTQCFQLNELGTHTIKLQAYGGRYGKTALNMVFFFVFVLYMFCIICFFKIKVSI